jgi:hypothetical protein
LFVRTFEIRQLLTKRSLKENRNELGPGVCGSTVSHHYPQRTGVRGHCGFRRHRSSGEESAQTGKHETARDLLKQRQGDVAKGVPMSAKIGRLRFDDAAADMLTDYKINGKRSHDNLKNTIIAGALEPGSAGGAWRR